MFQTFDQATEILQAALGSSYLDAFLENAENLVDGGQVRVEDGIPNETDQAKLVHLYQHKTRKIYIDSMLLDAGWTEGKDWIDEMELPGMPNKSEVGFADYVLYDDSHKPLAVIEAKRTCVDVRC